MKATKIASIFAVTAVAAAVSTTTFAADAVFTGTAGLYVTTTTPDEGDDSTENTSAGEVNLIIDTGTVYFDMDMGTATDANGDDYNVLTLDEAYATLGAVQLGDFDGSLFEDTAVYSGVYEENDYGDGFGNTIGVRYTVGDITIAYEGTDGPNDDYDYSGNETALVLGYFGTVGPVDLSTAYYIGLDGSETTAFGLGASIPVGSVVTLSGYMQSGDTEADDSDFGSTGFGVDLAFSESFSLAVALLDDTEEDNNDNLEVTATYAVDDVSYFATMVDYNEDASDDDYTLVGVEVSF